MNQSIWFATCARVPLGDSDDLLVVDELRKRGLQYIPKIWDDPNVDWNDCQFAVIRSTWDYCSKYEAFQAWLSAPYSASFWNPPSVLRWNTCKTYLRELESKGIRIVPTLWLDQSASAVEIESTLANCSWQGPVLKPVIGASAKGVRKLDLADQANSKLAIMALLKTSDAMLQPYMQAIENSGERSLIFIGGQYVHTVRRVPFKDFAHNGSDKASLIEPEPDEMELAKATLECVGENLLYARVDVVRSEEDKVCLMELELVEPSLFLDLNPQAASSFADAIELLVASRV